MSTKDLLLMAFAGVGAYAAYLQIKKMKSETAQTGAAGGTAWGGTDFTSLLNGSDAFVGNKYDFYALSAKVGQGKALNAL